MNNTDKKTPSCLDNHPDVAESYQNYINKKLKISDETLRVAVCGVYNAGKSSLLNVLIGEFQEETEAFKTGAARVTTAVTEKRIGKIIYIDTPGIDGAEQDDEAAWSGILNSDYLMYAHRLQAAEFQKQEINFLRSLKNRVHGLEDRLALIITQIDEISDENESIIRQKSILDAFESAVGFKPRIKFLVSSRRFATGSKKGKAGLITHSRIPEIKSWIEKIANPADRSARQKFQKNQLEINRTELIKQLETISTTVKIDHQRLTNEHEARILSFEAMTIKLASTLRSTLKRIDAI
ncbi:GTPase [Malikia spinosa]|jgi:GTPase SAR1 family protein|uniref:GTPase n=1 Tax=Malikia spinosa TaxID=86180 RepID=UPI0026D1D065|nr:GTPase [Malikia spinosa]